MTPGTPMTPDRLREGERQRLRDELARYHGGKQDGVAHSHDKCRLLNELDAADEWVRQALRDRQDAIDAARRELEAATRRETELRARIEALRNENEDELAVARNASRLAGTSPEWDEGFHAGWNDALDALLATDAGTEPPIIEVEGAEGVVHRVWDTDAGTEDVK